MAGYITRKIQNNFISDKVYCSPTWCNLTNAPIPDNRYINSLTNTIDPKMDYFIGIRLFFSSSMRRKKRKRKTFPSDFKNILEIIMGKFLQHVHNETIHFRFPKIGNPNPENSNWTFSFNRLFFESQVYARS